MKLQGCLLDPCTCTACCLSCPSIPGSIASGNILPGCLPLEWADKLLYGMPNSIAPHSLQAYDRSLVRLRGSNAATNFSISDYRADLADYYKMQQVSHIVFLSPSDLQGVTRSARNITRFAAVQKQLKALCARLQKVLQGDGTNGEDLLKSGSEFERWIKLGLSSIDEPQGITAEG